MAILCGIKANVMIDDMFAREYRDRGQNTVLNPTRERKAANKLSNFIAADEDEFFTIQCTLQQDFDLDCDYLAFLVSVNGKNVSFKFFETSSLKGEKNKPILTCKQLRGNDEENFNFVDLSIIKMKKPVSMVTGLVLDEPLVQGELLSMEKNRCLGEGKHKIYQDLLPYYAYFEDPLDFPTALFTWKYAYEYDLRELLIMPRKTTKVPFKILLNPDRFPDAGLDDITASPWTPLIRGKSLAELDGLVFKSLYISPSGLGIDQAEEMASKHASGQDVSDLTIGKVLKMAKGYAFQKVRAQIHTRTLRILAEPKYRESVPERHGMNATTANSELERFSNSVLEDMAGEQGVCGEILRTMTIREVETLASEHLPDDSVADMSIFDVKKFAIKRLMEKRYFAAQVQAVRRVAGEKLLACQQPPNIEQRPVDALAANANTQVKREPHGRAGGSRVVQEAPAAVLGEDNSNGNPRKRTRSQSQQTQTAEGTVKRRASSRSTRAAR